MALQALGPGRFQGANIAGTCVMAASADVCVKSSCLKRDREEVTRDGEAQPLQGFSGPGTLPGASEAGVALR
jgi:hypothetical protein